jgi:hypothetical protein
VGKRFGKTNLLLSKKAVSKQVVSCNFQSIKLQFAVAGSAGFLYGV